MDPYKVLGVPASQARWGKIPFASEVRWMYWMYSVDWKMQENIELH